MISSWRRSRPAGCCGTSTHEVGAVRMQRGRPVHRPRRSAGDPAGPTGRSRRRSTSTSTSERVLAGTDTTMPDARLQPPGWPMSGPAGTACCSPPPPQTVAELNSRARADLIAAGQVAVDGVPLRDGTAAGVGDRVATRRNERRLAVNAGRDWVKNGDGWRVLAVHDDGVADRCEHRTPPRPAPCCPPTTSPTMSSWTTPAPSAAPRA